MKGAINFAPGRHVQYTPAEATSEGAAELNFGVLMISEEKESRIWELSSSNLCCYIKTQRAELDLWPPFGNISRLVQSNFS